MSGLQQSRAKTSLQPVIRPLGLEVEENAESDGTRRDRDNGRSKDVWPRVMKGEIRNASVTHVMHPEGTKSVIQ